MIGDFQRRRQKPGGKNSLHRFGTCVAVRTRPTLLREKVAGEVKVDLGDHAEHSFGSNKKAEQSKPVLFLCARPPVAVIAPFASTTSRPST